MDSGRTQEAMEAPAEKIPGFRLGLGAFIFVLGFASPVFIPWVLSSSLPAGLKAFLAGALAFGIPELAMLAAVAILGKKGFRFLKERLGRIFKPFAPPDHVSPQRYKIGLVLFILPLLTGWILPYLQFHWEYLGRLPLYIYVIGDFVLLVSIFVLGGEFWDKLRALFTQKATVQWKE